VIATLIAAQLGVVYKPLSPEIYGLEGEFGPLGALVQLERYDQPAAWQLPLRATLWGKWPITLPNGFTPFTLPNGAPAVSLPKGCGFDAIAGVNWYPDSAYVGQALPDAWRYVGPVVGVSYTLTSGRLWLRVSPNVTLSLDPPYREGSWWLKSGIPWLEAGFRPFPGLELSFGLRDAPVKLAWVF